MAGGAATAENGGNQSHLSGFGWWSALQFQVSFIAVRFVNQITVDRLDDESRIIFFERKDHDGQVHSSSLFVVRHDDGPLVKLFLQTHTDSLTGISPVLIKIRWLLLSGKFFSLPCFFLWMESSLIDFPICMVGWLHQR